MRLRQHRQQQEQIEAPQLISERPITDISEFVEASELMLNDSSRHWRDVAYRVSHISSPQLIDTVKADVKATSEYYFRTMSDTAVDNEAKKIVDNFSLHCLLTARYAATIPRVLPTQEQKELTRKLFGFSEKSQLLFLIESPMAPLNLAFADNYEIIRKEIKAADEISQNVLIGFTNLIEDNPETLEEIVELYEGGIAEEDPSFRELRNIIHADWNNAYQENSILRKYISFKQEPSEQDIDSFIEYVSTHDEVKKAVAIQRMAKFAIAAAKSSGHELTIGDVLKATYPKWGEYEEIDSLFKIFMSNKKKDIEFVFAKLAGYNNLKSIRIVRRLEDIEQHKNNVFVSIGDRDSRRQGKPKVKRTRGLRAPLLPDTKEIEASAETEQTIKPLKIAKNVEGIYCLKSIEQSEVNDAFNVSTGSGTLKEDVLSMIDFLRKDPVSRASKILTDTKITIKRADGRVTKVPLRRFAPEDANGNLKIHGDNRYHRIVYALADDSIVLVSISGHENYNKTYGAG